MKPERILPRLRTLSMAILLAAGSLGAAAGPAAAQVDSLGAGSGGDRAAEGYTEYLKGIFMEKEGDFPGAFLQFRKADGLNPGDPEVLIAIARTGLQVGRVRDARVALDEVKKLGAMDHEAYILSAQTNYLLGRRRMLQRDLDQARKLAPRDKETLDFISRVYIQDEEYEKALEVLEEIKAIDPDDPRVPYRLGFLLTQLDRTDEAVEAFEEALRLSPESDEAALALAAIYEARDEEEKAIEIYRKLVERENVQPEALERLVHVYYRRNDYEHGIELLRPIYDEGRLGYELTFLMAELYYRDGEFDDADEVLLAMLENFGDRVEIYRMLGDVAARSQRFDDAESYFDRAIDLDPNEYASYLSLFFLNSGYFDAGAERTFGPRSMLLLTQAAALVEPEDFRGQFLVGVAYKDLDSLVTAEEYLARAVALRPESREALFNLGIALEGQGKYEACEKRMSEYLKRVPDDPVILNFYGYLLAEQGIKLRTAEKKIKKALKLEPDNGYYTDSLGWVYFQKKKYRRALKELEKANQLVENDPTILEHLGDAYVALRRYEDALSAYRRSIELQPENQEVLEKLRTLERKIDR